MHRPIPELQRVVTSVSSIILSADGLKGVESEIPLKEVFRPLMFAAR